MRKVLRATRDHGEPSNSPTIAHGAISAVAVVVQREMGLNPSQRGWHPQWNLVGCYTIVANVEFALGAAWRPGLPAIIAWKNLTVHYVIEAYVSLGGIV